MPDEAPAPPLNPVENESVLECFGDRVREQMERIVASRYFSRSHRLSSFLRYVVDQTLSGRGDQIKERTIGTEVFGRPADYETASDSIVRVTAAEVRKRIAQYYQEVGQENEIRVAFAAGSYVPQFQVPDPAIKTEESPAASLPADPPSAKQTSVHHHFWRGFIVSSFIAVLIGLGSTWAWHTIHRAPFDFFWGPILKSSGPVLFCIADQERYPDIGLRSADDPTRQIVRPDSQTAVFIDDIGDIVHIAGLLHVNGKRYVLRGESTTTLADLRGGPTILIGAFDNAWTLRLTRTLRYRFTNNEQMTELGIVNSHDPAHNWIVNRTTASNNYTDYAIIARFTDSITGEPAVVVAGVTSGGTVAAGEFLTSAGNLAQLMRADKAAGDKPNMEIVLRIPIIGGDPGAPGIVAADFW